LADTPAQAQAHKQLRERWERLEFDGLSQPEQEAIALYWLEGEVMNGGLIQYFTNSSGDLSLLARSGLERLGCLVSLGLLDAAISRLHLGASLGSREARNDAVERLVRDADPANGMVDPFDAETNALVALPEDFFGLALDDLSRHYASDAPVG
jgi:hypothetical protein